MSKFHNIKCVYKGEIYDSKKEMQYAMWLESERQAGRIRWWRRQIPLELVVNDQKIAKVVVDFLVEFPDRRQEYHEVKSPATITPLFKIKYKLTRVLYPDIIYKIIQ